jgi:hypothetical protein
MAAETWDVRDLLPESPTPQALTTAEVGALAEQLAAYHARFAPCFRRSEQRTWAEVYLRGLLIADIPRKNTEAMALRLLGAGDGAQALTTAERPEIRYCRVKEQALFVLAAAGDGVGRRLAAW